MKLSTLYLIFIFLVQEFFLVINLLLYICVNIHLIHQDIHYVFECIFDLQGLTRSDKSQAVQSQKRHEILNFKEESSWM